MYRSVMRNKDKTYDLQGIPVTIKRKKVKNINLRISRTSGDVLVSAPNSVPEAYILGFLYSRLDWIQERYKAAQARESVKKKIFVDGEYHAFLGQQYPLRITHASPKKVQIKHEHIEITCSENATIDDRQRYLEQWYRSELNAVLDDLVEKWTAILGVNIRECRIKKMKTKWGTCNITDRRIWINLELVKYPFECIEYVLLHEFAHLFERYHNQRFYAILSAHMPDWEKWDKLLDDNA